MVKCENNSPDALLTALKEGSYYSSQGPRLHDVWVADNRVHVRCSPADRIMAVGAGAASKVVYGNGMAHADLPLARFKEGGWVRVVIADGTGKRAWSNPIWLDS